MRVYFFDREKNWWFRSEVYAVICARGYDKQLLCYETGSGLYMQLLDYLDRTEGGGNTHIHVIDENRPAEWIRIRGEDEPGLFDRLGKILPEKSKFFEYTGFRWLWEDTETMDRLLQGEAIPVKGSVFEDKLYSDKNTEEWNYIETQADVDYFMNETAGLHDSVLHSMEYTSGAYVDKEGWMLPLDTKRKMSLLFQSQVCGGVEIVFEGTIALNLRPTEDNYTSEIFGCTWTLEDGIVNFFDGNSAMDHYDLSDYGGTCASAYGVKWKLR